MDYNDKQEAQFYNFGDNNCDLDGDGLNGSVGLTPANPAEGEPGCGIGFDAVIDPFAIPDLNDTQFSDNIQYAIVPAEEVEIYGIELEAGLQVGDSGYLKGFATYTHAEYKEFTYSHVLGCDPSRYPVAPNWCDPHDVSGNQPRSTPEWTANLTYSHTFDLGEMGNIVPTINAYYRSEYFLTPENVSEGDVSAADVGLTGNDFDDGTPGVNNNERDLFADVQEASLKVNLNITWYLPNGLELEAFANNLTDEEVRSHIRIDTANTPLFAHEDPREYGARLRYKF